MDKVKHTKPSVQDDENHAYFKYETTYNTKKLPNSKGSLYNGCKLSNIALDEKIEHQDNCEQIIIGCDDDDTFYKKEDEGRLKVYIETTSEMTSFDLEDFLKESKKLCPHLF